MEDMDQSMEKKMDGPGGGSSKGGEKMDLFGGLGDEMGMEWDDIVNTFSGSTDDGKSTSGTEPWVSSHFNLGAAGHEKNYKLSAWKIVKGSMNANGATIKLDPQKNDRSYLNKGKMLNKGTPDTQTYHLSRRELINFLTKGWTPAIQAAAAGGAGGAGAPGSPGAPPPMGM